MPPKINFGVFLPCHTFNTEKRVPQLFNNLQETVQECERLEYHSIWLDDHLMLNSMPILECWTTLSAISRTTKKIRLGTMVTCNSFRNPALIAKMAATLDNISDGRIEFGIGAGVQKNEHEAYGFSFPSTKERIDCLGETLQIIKRMWVEQKASYHGKHYCIVDAICEPKPIQKPYPPIIVAGGGEKFTLRVTAQHANRFDFGYLPNLEKYKHKLNVLKHHCESVGRQFDDIEQSCWPTGQIFIGENKRELLKKIRKKLPEGFSLNNFVKTSFVGTPEDCIKLLQPYVKMGVTQFMLFFGDLPELDGLKLFAEKVAEKIN
jgi:F420-dependent oxidoreductase-like protein